MSEQDEFEISASEKGVSIKSAGEAASRLAHTLADLLSPFSNAAGAVGDEIGYFRIGRRESVKFALERARRIRSEQNIENKPVSPKLLAPWLHNVSFEDLEDNHIIEIWAKVLARAPSKFDAEIAAIIDSLSRLGEAEARMFSEAYGKLIPSLDNFYSPEHAVVLDRLGISYDKLSKEDPLDTWHLTKEWLGTVTEGGILYYFRIESVDPSGKLVFDQSNADAHDQVRELLVREGFLTRREHIYKSEKSLINFLVIEVTRLGVRLHELLTGEKINLEGSE